MNMAEIGIGILSRQCLRIGALPIKIYCSLKSMPGRKHAMPKSEPSSGTSLDRTRIEIRVGIMSQNLRVDVQAAFQSA